MVLQLKSKRRAAGMIRDDINGPPDAIRLLDGVGPGKACTNEELGVWSTGGQISRSLRKNYVGTHAHRRSAQLVQHEHGPAGCSKRLSSKAAASEGPRRTLGVR
jgi:hypothetical protein